MQYVDDLALVRSTLPGRWIVAATNMPLWVTGQQRQPVVEYSVFSESPLRLRVEISYTDAAGRLKTLGGIDRWHGNGFTWRGEGLKKLVRSHWHVAAIHRDIVTVRFDKSLVTPAGVDLFVPEGHETAELRSVVAVDPEAHGLSLEEFASLTWFDHTLPAR
ncbi:MAG TPA: hypothetical protein VNT53_03295 [Pseudolysinimonas sp.]|nr:hypothetical protein [Pseudolysinimonas sp.]